MQIRFFVFSRKTWYIERQTMYIDAIYTYILGLSLGVSPWVSSWVNPWVSKCPRRREVRDSDFIEVYTSIYHVCLYIPCSLLYIPCSLLYIHGSLLYIPCFPRKKRICKIMYNSGFELTISCRPQGRANHCTTSVDTGLCLCTVLVC